MRRFVLLCLVGACAGETPADLLVLEEVSPSALEAGSTLRIRGRGFPPGRPGSVRLRGSYVRPGQEPTPVDVSLSALAVSHDAAEAVLDADAIHRLGGRGTLHGEIVLSFEARPSGNVAGHLPVDLDVGPVGVAALRERARAAVSAPRAFGVTLADDPLVGSRVDQVAQGSPADRAGVQGGDRIVEVSGVRVRNGADLQLLASAPTVVVTRDGVAGELILRVPDPPTSNATSVWLLLLVPLAGWWVLGPGVRELRRVTPKGARPRARRLVVMALVALAASFALGRWSVDLAFWLAGSLVLRAASDFRLRAAIPEVAVWFAAIGCALVAGSTESGAAWGALSESSIARAPLLWGLFAAAIASLGGGEGLLRDVHRAYALTLLVALGSGGLDHGPLLAVAATLGAACTAWLPKASRRWAALGALAVLAVHAGSLLLVRPPSPEEALAWAVVMAALPTLALLWPRRRVPRLHAYL
ncbi:MAG: PDZ domain-containing protein [Myxococcota bacterium]